MNDERINYIVGCMGSSEGMRDIQRIQTEHRLKLIQFWGIESGSNVLEIGCGQGDTTAALAFVVGEEGYVHGVDIAAPTYGSPLTLGESANYLKQSELGTRINMEFNIDVLSPDFDFCENAFDYIVFSHCSWYLKSFEELEEILKKNSKWGKKLCFAEWDTRIQTLEQYPHFLAALIQSQVECYKESSLSNVRTLFTPMDVRRIAEDAGWKIREEQSIHSPELQDAKWEIEMTLADYQEVIRTLETLPDKLKRLIQSEVSLLEETRSNTEIKPMSTFAFIAELKE